MTAGVLWLGLKLLGAPKVALYDEVSHAMHAVIKISNSGQSWTGYASRASSKIVKADN